MSNQTVTAMNAHAGQGRQRGVILIVCMAFLLMLTVLSISMFKNLGLEERITGNTREKQHAFFAAQSALEYAETWVDSGNASFGTTCSMTSATTSPVVCTQASTLSQTQFATDTWTFYGASYSPPAVTINGTSTSQMPTTQYASPPQYSITYLGSDPAKSGAFLYQITALGFGGNANATAVVQSVYSVGSGGSCVSCSH